jgi:hypothetical protein
LNIEIPENSPPGVRETLGGDSIVSFESGLSARTKVPAERLGDFLGWNETRVRREARVVSGILKRFAEAVVQSMDDAESMNNFLIELDLKAISRDHDWRAIFSAVREHEGEESDQYKRAVLIKYLQYLSFRKRLLDFIHARKAGLEETDELCADLTQLPRSVESADEDSSIVRVGVAAAATDGFARMPLGETVEFALGAEEVFEFLLARHRFELVGGVHPYVVDRNGVTCFVRPGRNMVGRHPESDLTVDANFSAVSRAHLVLEWDGEQQFRMMDLSTGGTWLREKVLAKLSAVARPEDLLEPMID